MNAHQPILVLGSSGKTGRRVLQRLASRGIAARGASRSTRPPFDWNEPSTWRAALAGVRAAYVAYSPDLAVPGAAETIEAFADAARAAGVRRLVLLSGRGEDEAQRSERIVQRSGLEWTILRASWFAQNFSEGSFRDGVVAGRLELPADAVREPFVDADDIADVAVAALTEARHAGQVYELTGPRPLRFAEALDEIGRAVGRQVRYAPVPLHAFSAALAAMGEAPQVVALLAYLFGEVLDGRNAGVADGVQRALGRPPRDFADFARDAAAQGAWSRAERPAVAAA